MSLRANASHRKAVAHVQHVYVVLNSLTRAGKRARVRVDGLRCYVQPSCRDGSSVAARVLEADNANGFVSADWCDVVRVASTSVAGNGVCCADVVHNTE